MQLCPQTAADTALEHHFVADCVLFDFEAELGGGGDGDGRGGWDAIPFFYIIPNKYMHSCKDTEQEGHTWGGKTNGDLGCVS